MKQGMLWAVVMILATMGTVACSKQAANKRKAEPRVLKGANDFGKDDAKRPRLELSEPEPKLEVLASVGDCAPKHQNELAIASCFNNTPCRGQWARTAEANSPQGSVDCWCFAKKGGCEEGTICCAASRRCEKPERCYVP
jgi:hypothetical protein